MSEARWLRIVPITGGTLARPGVLGAGCDKFYAHFDKAYFFDRKRIDADAPLRWSDLERVLDLLTETINRYSGSYDGQLFHLAPLNVNDVDGLLNELHRMRTKGGS